MLPRRAGRPPLGLILLILGVTIVPLATLLWLGYQVELRERQLEAHQVQQQVEHAADLVVAALQRAVSSTAQGVAAGAADWPAGAVVVTFRDARVSTAPPHALAYYPVVETPHEAPASAFDEVDEFEFRNMDRARALETARGLAGSRDPAVQATATFRLARLLNADGRRSEALSTYLALTSVDDVSMAGVPMALAARYARCALFAERRDAAALRVEAEHLRTDLRAGRWRLTEPTYRLYARDVDQWSGAAAGPPTSEPKEVLAEAVRVLWDRRGAWPLGGASVPPEVLMVQGQSLTVLPQTGPGFTRALIATPAFVESAWLAAAASIAREQHIAFTLGSGANTSQPVARRTAAQAQLPWGVVVNSLAAPGSIGDFAARRQLLAAGLGVLVVVSLLASYVALRAVNRELAVARLQSDFVAAVSHEFRTPLTSLRQFTDMLREGGAPDDARRQVCYEAQGRATDRLTHLVESLLDFGRMEAGARPYHFEPHDSAEIVAGVVDDFRREVQPAGYQIALRRGDSSSTEIDVDREALARAVRNLLDNAVKYSPDDRSIDVTIERRDESVAIAVRDRGIGVPPGERAAIFGRFQRGDEARRRGIKGTGIGLAMVDHIVRAHGGRVQVESQPGQGSTFTILIPAITRA
jgi:signal transduction histidine kinase